MTLRGLWYIGTGMTRSQCTITLSVMFATPTINEFGAQNISPTGIFPSVLIGPGQGLPHPQPQHPSASHVHTAPANSHRRGKRKRGAPPASGEALSVGGFGP